MVTTTNQQIIPIQSTTQHFEKSSLTNLYPRVLLKFVKGGTCINKFAIARGCHLVNVSHGMKGVRWSQEEWKLNMAELEVSVVFDEKKNAQTKSDFFTDDGF